MSELPYTPWPARSILAPLDQCAAALGLLSGALGPTWPWFQAVSSHFEHTYHGFEQVLYEYSRPAASLELKS